MCTVNMTFEVPESKHIDIEALKQQVNNFVNYLITVPGIVWKESEEEVPAELLDRLEKARQEVRDGNCTTLRSMEEINAFFESL